MTTINKYPGLIGSTNIFKNECTNIAENIRKCILSKQPTTCSFQEKREQFLLLHIHCEDELQTLTSEFTRKKTRFDYKLVYNTLQPYHIHYDDIQHKVSITQHTFL
jgi:hypothetical protein